MQVKKRWSSLLLYSDDRVRRKAPNPEQNATACCSDDSPAHSLQGRGMIDRIPDASACRPCLSQKCGQAARTTDVCGYFRRSLQIDSVSCMASPCGTSRKITRCSVWHKSSLILISSVAMLSVATE